MGNWFHKEISQPNYQRIVCTVDDPSGVMVEASRERLAILMKNDCAGLALDTAETDQAQNSLEKMLAHQVACL